MSNCDNCESSLKLVDSLQQELKLKNQQLERLTLDLQALNQKYVAEIERVGNIQHEKDLVEHELEDLSRKLFEEANEMVAVEKRARYQLENELKLTQEHLIAEKTQLHELRLRLLSTDRHHSVIHNKKRKSKAKSMPALAAKKQPGSSFDDVQLDLFREFVETSSTKQLTMKKINQTDFMKHCLSEDIEPCLRFGSQSKLSTKKMIESFSRQTCFIEIASDAAAVAQQQSTNIWNKKNKGCCSACGRSTVSTANNYQFRLDENDHWLLIDKYCRDRIVAVCDFFVFIRNIQLGLYSDRSIQDLYSENIRLRLQIFYSRMGANNNSNNNKNESVVDEDDDDEEYISDSSSLAGPNTPESSHLSPLANQYNLDNNSLIK
ncbi:hypothetical protein G6F35_008816 [Rhizopus arrhizus]|nr:hypothetical protein G6F35_008816 [Rhizopus arrhizus]KAG1401683.1 hypothetical protein G6F60_006223 [Rhizopus arrhizus]